MSHPRLDSMSNAAYKAIEALDNDCLLEFWEIDTRNLGGGIYRFINTAVSDRPVIWQGVAYEPYPIKGDGFEMKATGSSNRPKLTVGNILGFVTGAVMQYGQMLGAVIYRRQVFAQFLDAANFPDGNPTADPLQEIKTKFVIERLSSLTAETGVFELAVPSESDSATIPCRIMQSDLCCWQYRGEGCGYTGGRLQRWMILLQMTLARTSAGNGCYPAEPVLALTQSFLSVVF